ncbi:MAG: hypothetical protein GC172_10990 [Phycisphaera sp.]|nr:hypothetical protein [Phycisphaera sp.]
MDAHEQPDSPSEGEARPPQSPAQGAFPPGAAATTPHAPLRVALPPLRVALPPLRVALPPLRVALALHTDGLAADHLDLFIGPDQATDPDARIARSYRLPLEARAGDSIRVGSHDAMELEPHRAEYLALAGPRELSDGRGRVEPVFSARARGEIAANRFDLAVDHADGPLRLRGARGQDGRWTVEAHRHDGAGTRRT